MTLKRLSLLLLLSLCGCAAWQAGIHNPSIVSTAIAEVQPYKQVADSIYPHAGVIIGALLTPLLILWGGYRELKKK